MKEVGATKDTHINEIRRQRKRSWINKLFSFDFFMLCFVLIYGMQSMLLLAYLVKIKEFDVKEDKEEVVSTSNEIKNPPRVESPADVNLREGQEFLAANSLKEGVVTLESGMQYKVLIPGSGVSPLSTDRVSVHYHGTLIDGRVFDSSVERGTPASFGVTQVIQGWIEALQLMNPGSKWILYIPGDLAYGVRGSGDLIGPNATLVFEVELLGIE